MTNQQSLANISKAGYVHLECFSLRITLANKYGNLFSRAFKILGNCVSSSHEMFFLTTSRKFQQVALNNDVLCVRFLMLQSTLFFSDSLSLFSERIPSIACSCYRDCLLYMLIKQAICQKCHWKWEVLAQYSTIKMKFCKTSHISLESICEGVPFK